MELQHAKSYPKKYRILIRDLNCDRPSVAAGIVNIQKISKNKNDN